MKFRLVLGLHKIFVWISDVFTGLAVSTDEWLYPDNYKFQRDAIARRVEEEANEIPESFT